MIPVYSAIIAALSEDFLERILLDQWQWQWIFLAVFQLRISSFIFIPEGINVYLWIYISRLMILFFHHVKRSCASPFLPPWFGMRNPQPTELLLPYRDHIFFFFFGCFENSLCVLFSTAWLWYVRAWISLSLFSLGFAELLDSIGLCIFPNLGSFSQYFFIIALFPLILMTQTLELLCWPTGPWGSAHFSNLYLCSSDWVFAMDLSLSSLTLFFFFLSSPFCYWADLWSFVILMFFSSELSLSFSKFLMISNMFVIAHWDYSTITSLMCVCVCVCVCTRARAARSVMSDSLRPHGLQPARFLCPWGYPGKNAEAGCHSLLQGIFLTQESNPGLLHCRQIFCYLSHQGSPV